MAEEFILKMSDITKRFPGVLALDHVSLYVKKGEVHALLGENGAGKSTLMKILAGAYVKDEGEIEIFSEKTELGNPKAADDPGRSEPPDCNHDIIPKRSFARKALYVKFQKTALYGRNKCIKRGGVYGSCKDFPGSEVQRTDPVRAR